MSESSSDPTVRRLREEVSEVDRTIVAAVNTRLELVTRLKQHKESLGLPFLDPDREHELVEALLAANGGPLSEDGLRELHAELLALTKREVGRGIDPG